MVPKKFIFCIYLLTMLFFKVEPPHNEGTVKNHEDNLGDTHFM